MLPPLLTAPPAAPLPALARSVVTSFGRFHETKLLRDGGSGKVLLECRAAGQRRRSWTVLNAKGHEVMHVKISRPSWWQRLRQRGAGEPQAWRLARLPCRPPATQP